jgi:hypothetical protein
MKLLILLNAQSTPPKVLGIDNGSLTIPRGLYRPSEKEDPKSLRIDVEAHSSDSRRFKEGQI